jgi:hypothetical protein
MEGILVATAARSQNSHSDSFAPPEFQATIWQSAAARLRRRIRLFAEGPLQVMVL